LEISVIVDDRARYQALVGPARGLHEAKLEYLSEKELPIGGRGIEQRGVAEIDVELVGQKR